jgi:hypothetical protein
MIETTCHSCGDAMASKKPSLSGASFCSKKLCQAAKQRFYRKRRKTGLQVERDGDFCLNYMRRALHDERNPCPRCGLEDAVGPYIHRDARDPQKPCTGTGGVGGAELPIYWVDVVHPELAARAAG